MKLCLQLINVSVAASIWKWVAAREIPVILVHRRELLITYLISSSLQTYEKKWILIRISDCNNNTGQVHKWKIRNYLASKLYYLECVVSVELSISEQ